MATRTDVHHAICVTDDEGGVAARLRAVLGLPSGAGTLAWEPGGDALIATILGPESSGTIEVVRLPAELQGRLTPGTTAISFAVDDLDARVGACRTAGLPVSVVPGDIAFAVVTAAGLDFELVRFEL
ncbi:MAG TPA: hypothetical protein VFS16_20245 [Acidimicrobiia bacterium]|nr:hypothetical protein [Acidimicrobiia bacterium]